MSADVSAFETKYWYTAVFIIFLYTIVVVIYIELCRRFKGFQIVFCGLVFVLYPTYLYYGTLSMLEWLQFIVVIGIIIAMLLLRYSEQARNHRVYSWLFYALFVSRILCSFFIELVSMIHRHEFHLNLITAALLILCTNLPLSSSRAQTIFVSNENSLRTLNYEMNVCYMLAFTIWNYAFSLNTNCYEKLLNVTVYNVVPFYFIIFGKLSSRQILQSEWICLQCYALLLWYYIDSLPPHWLSMVPFWNIAECQRQSVSLAVAWSINGASMLAALLLLFSHIYPLMSLQNSNATLVDDVSNVTVVDMKQEVVPKTGQVVTDMRTSIVNKNDENAANVALQDTDRHDHDTISLIQWIERYFLK